MQSFLLDMDTKMYEVLLRAYSSGKDTFFCIVDGTKPLGIITFGDIARLTLQNRPDEYLSKKALEVATKDFIKFHLETLETEVINFLGNNRSKNISKVPLVDSSGNLISIFDIDSFAANFAWNISQEYELNWWSNSADLQTLINRAQKVFSGMDTTKIDWKTDAQRIDINTEQNILRHISGKTVLEIGCGPVCGYLPYMWKAKERIAIEPLLDKYAKFWRDSGNVHMSDIIDVKYSVGADFFIPELVNRIDGLIISSNALDHTPNWPFVLSNISSYARNGSYLYLWTDIHHAKKPNEGHYNITPNADNIFRMIENLGYKIIIAANNSPLERDNLYIRLVAVKMPDIDKNDSSR